MNKIPQDPPLSPDTNDSSPLALPEGGDPPHVVHRRTRVSIHAVIPAAGFGQRFDPGAGSASKAKQYYELGGEAVIVRTVSALLAVELLGMVWVVLAPADQEGQSLLEQRFAACHQRLRIARIGGAQRRDSVLAGLKLAKESGANWVMVHDAARPLISRAAIERLISRCLRQGHGGILGLPVVDTVKRARSEPNDPLIEQTIPRERLWLAQTPQLFPADRLVLALERFPEVTDEAAAIEKLGDPVVLVKGEPGNIKLTYADDVHELALRLNQTANPLLRVGEGYDVHALVPGRALMIGGVRIDYPLGLLGHSDADVLLHAITDALLGAAGLGDIGTHFPDHDPKWRGVDSRVLLSKTVDAIQQHAWSIQNIDCTVVAQRPKLLPYRDAIIDSLACCLRIERQAVNFKAKTQELLGFEGRGEGISARAVAMIANSVS